MVRSHKEQVCAHSRVNGKSVRQHRGQLCLSEHVQNNRSFVVRINEVLHIGHIRRGDDENNCSSLQKIV